MMSILTAHSLTRTKMHTSHNNIAHSNLWLTSYTLTDFLMLLYLIPSHATISESLTQQPSPSLHPLMLLSHSVRSRLLSHVSLVSRSHIVARSSLPFPHATLSPNTNLSARSLTRSRYLALLISLAQSLLLSLSQGQAAPSGSPRSAVKGLRSQGVEPANAHHYQRTPMHGSPRFAR